MPCGGKVRITFYTRGAGRENRHPAGQQSGGMDAQELHRRPKRPARDQETPQCEEFAHCCFKAWLCTMKWWKKWPWGRRWQETAGSIIPLFLQSVLAVPSGTGGQGFRLYYCHMKSMKKYFAFLPPAPCLGGKFIKLSFLSFSFGCSICQGPYLLSGFCTESSPVLSCSGLKFSLWMWHQYYYLISIRHQPISREEQMLPSYKLGLLSHKALTDKSGKSM